MRPAGFERAWGRPLESRGAFDSPKRLRAFRAALAHRSLRHSGLFPVDAGFLRDFTEAFAEAFRELDAVGLFLPLAAHVERGGRVGISLGGHLQVLFGVLGERWLERPEWRERYINDSWVRLPAEYVPDPASTGENYW